MRININLASLNVFRNQTNSVAANSKAIRYLSSGLKIISSGDDPNGLNKSEKMKMQIRSLEMAGRNVQTGASMLQAADGALSNVNSMLSRMRELVVGAGSAKNSDDLDAIKKELQQTADAIDGVVKTNDFNGVNVLYNEKVTDNSKPETLKMQSGSMVGEINVIPQYNLSKTQLGIDNLDISDSANIGKSIDKLDDAIDAVVSARSKFGAIEKKFEDMGDSMSAISNTIESAQSDITDTDYGNSMMELSRTNILIEAANAIMVQTNNLPQECLRILERVK
ncbi:flagellin [Clostridium oryzae]|uniref:Flagellin n=1 Tax=Clostridium oryzae TaxID=1450648 RepID=A0A1V4ITR3_9CLOT|nr:flagellin [Clostridium oryzae]OPJ63283.1 flagellin [Clostridium oryzae]